MNTMKSIIAGLSILVACSAAYSATPWHIQNYTNGHDVAKVIYEQAAFLSENHLRSSALIPLLSCTNVVFTETDGTGITVRDVAFTILLATDVVGLPEGSTSSKFIYCHASGTDIFYRAHIPVISDEGFTKTIETFQPSAAEHPSQVVAP